MDEPTSALDPIATSKVEDLLVKLKENYTIILVTHNMTQAARISDYSLFMYLGELVEYVITSYSIHYTKLYDLNLSRIPSQCLPGQL